MVMIGSDRDPLAVSISREGDTLRWRVHNQTNKSMFVYLLVPSIVEGRLSFAVDQAWLAAEGDRVVARKWWPPLPSGLRADPVRTGAIALAPDEAREGRVRLGGELALSDPYRPPTDLRRRRARELVLEVGWVWARSGQRIEERAWEGRPFVYVDPEEEPGGQRIARSTPIAW
jgi:hypothetical protein